MLYIKICTEKLITLFARNMIRLAIYECPCCGDGTLRDQNSSSCIGDRLDGSQMLLEAVGHHRVPVGGLLLASLTDIQLTGALTVDSLEGSGRKCQLRDVEGDGRSPLQCHQKLRASQGTSSGLGVAYGKGCFMHCHSPPLGPLTLWGWGMIGSLWGRAQMRGNPSAQHTRERSPRGRRS